MNKSKLILIVLLALAAVMLLAACGSHNPDSTGSTEGPGTTSSAAPADTSAAAPTQLSSIRIGDRDLSEYTIVYAQSEYSRYLKISQYRKLFPVYDFDRETAERLSDLIYTVSGIRLPVAEDKSTEAGECEILVGNTNRTDVMSALDLYALKSDDYAIAVHEGKMAVCGGEYGTTWHAVDYLETLFSETLAAGKTELAFDAEYSYSSTYHLTRIGCIGDSITEGVGSTNSAIFSYPAQLGRYLWKDALVINFGNSGKTMRNDLADSYIRTSTYSDALRQAANIDIFTVMLGTNDSNRDRDWTEADSKLYNDSCRSIFSALKKKNADLRFVLANCPAYFGSDGFGSATVRNLQEALVKTLNDEGFPTAFYDMYATTKEMRSLFPDSLHPNDEGHMKMAEAFAGALGELIDRDTSNK